MTWKRKDETWKHRVLFGNMFQVNILFLTVIPFVSLYTFWNEACSKQIKLEINFYNPPWLGKLYSSPSVLIDKDIP